MNKFQPGLKFRNTEDVIEYIPEDQKQMVRILRSLIFDAIPEIQEKINYNVPFYKLKKTVCYIWPGAIPWGGIKNGVIIGFARGKDLSNYDEYLSAGKRKNILTKQFSSSKDIDQQRLTELLYEALELDLMND